VRLPNISSYSLGLDSDHPHVPFSGYYVAAVVIIVVVTLVSIYHTQIVHWLTPTTQRIHEYVSYVPPFIQPY